MSQTTTRENQEEATRRPQCEAAASKGLANIQLEAMIQAATIDCYNESEEITGWFTMIEESLAVPFETSVLGVPVTVGAHRAQRRRPDRHRLLAWPGSSDASDPGSSGPTPAR